ncbi:MAG: hypothetical protein ABSE99_13000, partial [Terracidiphilus sp.]
TKEARYAHLLSGGVEALRAAAPYASMQREAGASSGPDAGYEERMAQLETTVAELRQEVVALRQKIDDLFGD